MIDETGQPLDEGGSDYGSDLSRDMSDGPPSSFRDSAPDLLAPDRRRRPGQRSRSDAGRRGVAVARSRARLGCGPERGRAAPAAGRHGRAASGRRQPERPRPEHLQPYPAPAGGGARASCRSSTPFRRPASMSWSTASTSCRGAWSRPRSMPRRWPTWRPGRPAPSGPARSPAAASSSRPTPARAPTQPGSCCPRCAPTWPRPSVAVGGPIYVGLPDRHLLVAGASTPDDAEFEGQLAGFVADHADGADEPIDRRLFVLVDGELRPAGA